jgi:hypothetical protein
MPGKGGGARIKNTSGIVRGHIFWEAIGGGSYFVHTEGKEVGCHIINVDK